MKNIKPKQSPPRVAFIGVRLSLQIKAAVEAAALADRRSISQWVEGLILHALAHERKK